MKSKKFTMWAAGAVTAAAVAMPAAATTLSFTINWGPNGPTTPPSGPIVGIAVKINSGSASVQSITNATTGAGYTLPTGWSQQTLKSSFVAGTNPNAGPSQYGFVRGGGGATHGTADSYGGLGTPAPLGFTASFLLDPSYTPNNNDTVSVIWTTFTDTGILSAQAGYTFTYSSSTLTWSGASFGGNPWSQADSGTFNQLSAAVVPGSGLAVIGSVGFAGMARRRRRGSV